MLKVLPKLLFVNLLLGMILFCNQTAVWAGETIEPRVQSVEVSLSITGKIYEGLQERIEFSISRVGEQVLLSQPISFIEKNKQAVKNAIFNVFSKVLIGFKIEAVDLSVGEHTQVVIELIPIAPFISEIDLNVEVKETTPELGGFVSEVSTKMEEELNRIFVGLPVAAIAWSDNIFNLVINYLIEREFPGFKGKFMLESGSKTKLNLILTPMDPLVSQVIVDYSSTSVPAMLVKSKLKDYQAKFDVLKGVPVEFLMHYQPRLERLITKYVNNFPELSNLGIMVNLKIRPGINTFIDLGIESQYYQIKLETRYFMGQEEQFGNFMSYFGYRTNDYELYTKLYLGDNPSGNYQIGCKLPISSNFYGGFEYELEHQYKNVWLNFQFERGDYLELRLGLDHSPNEALVGVFLNRHANLELVKFDNDFGLQLMFHF